MLEHIPKIIYACTIKNNKLTTYNTLERFFPNCTKAKKSTKYGYIITKNIGTNINVDMKISDLIIFIPQLIVAIKNFIIPLHNANYVLNNIYWNKQKVYFNISNMEKNTNTNEDIKKLINNIIRFHELGYIYNDLNDSKLDVNILIKSLENIIISFNDYIKMISDYNIELNKIDKDKTLTLEQKKEKKFYTGVNFHKNNKDKFRNIDLNIKIRGIN